VDLRRFDRYGDYLAGEMRTEFELKRDAYFRNYVSNDEKRKSVEQFEAWGKGNNL